MNPFFLQKIASSSTLGFMLLEVGLFFKMFAVLLILYNKRYKRTRVLFHRGQLSLGPKMKNYAKVVPLILFALLALGYVRGDNYSITEVDVLFDIQPDFSVRQTSNFTFDGLLYEKSINYTLSDMVSDIEVFDESSKLEYSIINEPDGRFIVQIFLKKPTHNIKLSYLARNVVFKSDSVNQFFTEFNFDRPVNTITGSVILPLGYEIYQNSFKPAEAVMSSDGRRIGLAWNIDNMVSSTDVSVKFAPMDDGASLMFVIASLVVSGLLGSLVISYVYFQRKTREAFLKGFREDEQKTVKFLQENKIALQSSLQSEFSFSRAKSTRIIMKLEGKGLVRKERLGRTNRIYWLR